MRLRIAECASVWCPAARGSVDHLAGGVMPSPVVVNREVNGDPPSWARCLGPQCAWWRMEEDAKWGYCGIAGRPE